MQLDEFRHPIVLYYFRELTYEQIADVLNISLPSVKTRLLIVRKKEDQIDLLNVSEFRLIKEENGWLIPLNPTK
ncbi:sigma factor-like helix-turn-helix DNA-binding protein [Viridibacillus sp. FSL R5-0468]|uniref:RNA polymerase sigma factor Y n=1 Tax=Viridibacillus arenosi FSL R5-213 TaxID=1227360 RepID=W4EPH7_9BACL|nr:RNA polymerase sigma factor Y [Viridibacillus arenosi FSL R5-213]